MSNHPNAVLNKFTSLTQALKTKKLLWGVVVIAIAAFAGYHFLAGNKKASGNYLTSTVKRATISSTISASGTIEPVTTVSLGFKNSETINKIYVIVGDHVTPGQLLAEEDTSDLETAVKQAQANLDSANAKLQLLKAGNTQQDIAQGEASVSMAQADYNQAKATLDRDQQLYQSGALAKADLDSATSALTNADGKLKQAQASLQTLKNGNRPEDIASQAAQVENSQLQLQTAQNDLAGAKLYSSIDGIVSAINGAEGQRATANNNNTSGGGFMTVISNALQLRAQVNESDIGRTQVGQNVEFTVNSFPNKTFTGVVNSVSPQATTVSNVQVYDVIIQLNGDTQGLKAGMPANVNVIVDRSENVLTVPKGAVTYASTYLRQMRQTAQQSGQGANNSGNSGSSGLQGGRRAGGNNSGNSSGNSNNHAGAPAGQADGSSTTQQAMVLVMDKSGTPTAQRVTLGISDLTNYEVVNGLNEGDIVIIGSLNQAASTSTGTQANQSRPGGNNNPFMGGRGH